MEEYDNTGVSYEADDQWEEYETRVITAICDCCSAVADGTARDLIRRRWLLGKREQICPNHE